MAIFTCLIILQLSITDANPILSSKSATVGNRQSGRKLVNFQRFIRSHANLTEDNQQFDVGATSEPFVATTEDLAPEDDTFDSTESSPIQSPSSFVISTASDPSEELPSLPLDVNFLQDTTENITPMSDIQDFSIMPVVDITESIAKELEDLSVNPEDGSQPSPTDFLINPQGSIEEIEIQSPSVASPSNPVDPPQSKLLISVTTASPDLPFTAAPADASTEISKKESTNKTEYSSFSSNEEEEQENISNDVMTHLPEKSTHSHESISNEEEYPVVVPAIVISKLLTNIAENPSTTEALQSTSTEPSDLPDFPIFYPGLRIATTPQTPEKEDPFPLNPSWSMKMNDIFSTDQQLQSGLENKMRPQFIHPRVVLPQFKPNQPLYPDVPNSYYTFQPNQPQFSQASSIDPPRAPYPHPQGNSSPFYYRPFESALPKPRRLVFPPISNTRENFRFHVNWADELMGRSNWA
ncbi:hypothetical protein DAPPUDRAFT_313721 [Daphnia pulex]|uniref:Uncharacterized protein n=1 Tax=Daphnia pulex TaxID=6669 RepID=E9G3Y9_DAPPU|nr:hypothetical protein DAPPUDRAFT_313721 [Daphnia pulex]|eukprot:EFX85903.1 hypothetical protein DAPPUDRAFT_313721 [Daphnia pulex]